MADKDSKQQVKAEPGLTEQETEQMQGLEDQRKNKDAPGGAGHLTDSERTLLSQLKKKVEDAKESEKTTTKAEVKETKVETKSGSGAFGSNK